MTRTRHLSFACQLDLNMCIVSACPTHTNTQTHSHTHAKQRQQGALKHTQLREGGVALCICFWPFVYCFESQKAGNDIVAQIIHEANELNKSALPLPLHPPPPHPRSCPTTPSVQGAVKWPNTYFWQAKVALPQLASGFSFTFGSACFAYFAGAVTVCSCSCFCCSSSYSSCCCCCSCSVLFLFVFSSANCAPVKSY